MPTGTTRASARHQSSRARKARASLAPPGRMSDRLDGGGAPDRGARAAPRRLRDERPRHRPDARLPPDRPDLDRRSAAAARPLEPPRPVRRRRARPPALGRAEALRVERVHLADRGPPAAPRAHAAAGAPALPRRAHGQRVPPRERELQALRPARARAQRAAAVTRAPEHDPAANATSKHPLVGSARSDAHARDPAHPRRRRGRRPHGRKQRLWDLAERWYPEVEKMPLREAERACSRSSASARSACG